MRTSARLSLFGAGLAALFAAAFAVGSAVIPDGAAAAWNEEAAGDEMTHDEGTDQQGADGEETDAHGDVEPGSGRGAGHGADVRGLSLEQDGYVLDEVTAPGVVGEDGELSFVVLGPDGHALTRFALSHEKELHLIVVRSDGAGFRHVHPEMSSDGTWTIPWAWDAPGAYRVFADFVPADGPDAVDVTLGRTVEVAGDVAPSPAGETRVTDSVDGFDVTLHGDLLAGGSDGSTLTVEITRDGAPVTTLEPYLGAFGHLVALREGDLAYLHVHPEGAEPVPGETSGPEIAFATQAPTPGRYLLYLDFQVAGEVRTATFVVDAAGHGGVDDGADGGEH